MKAVIETGGKQYVVSVGDEIYIEKLSVNDGDKVVFDKVLSVGEEGKVKFGNPLVSGAKVEGKLVKHGKAKKITVFTYRPKKGSARKLGHRQPYSKIEITAINA